MTSFALYLCGLGLHFSVMWQLKICNDIVQQMAVSIANINKLFLF